MTPQQWHCTIKAITHGQQRIRAREVMYRMGRVIVFALGDRYKPSPVRTYVKIGRAWIRW